MPKKAGDPAVPQIAKTIGKGYVLTPAQPSGAYDRLAAKDGPTVCWVMPRGSYIRLMFVADVTGAPKALLKDTVVTKGRVYLKVTEDNVEQARSLIAYAIERAPAKMPPKPKAKPQPRAASRRGSKSARSRRKPSDVVAKRRIRFRTPMGEIRSEDMPESEADAFVASLKSEGHEIL
jgi:hypothetical protein